MAPESRPDREIALAWLRAVLDRLIREGTATARTDGSVHHVFPVAVGPAESAAIRSWVIREHAARTVEVGLGYGIASRRCLPARACCRSAGRARVMSSTTRTRTPGPLPWACRPWARPERPGWWSST